MAAKRERKRQVQQQLFRRGGKRRGAGRKPNGTHALSYVLNNFRKHGEDREGLASTWLVDPFSSGISFPDWKELQGQAWMWPIRETYDPLIVRQPQSWLLREGWKRSGTISCREVPSAKQAR